MIIEGKVSVLMNQTFSQWEDLQPTASGTYALTQDTTYWGNSTINLNGTERIRSNLTANNLGVKLTNNSLFKFAWKFQSTVYDYIGFILYTPNNSFYITSDFGHTIFGFSC